MASPIETMLEALTMEPIEGAGETLDEDCLYATHTGVLQIGDVALKVYLLNNGERVFDADDACRVLGISALEGEGTNG